LMAFEASLDMTSRAVQSPRLHLVDSIRCGARDRVWTGKPQSAGRQCVVSFAWIQPLEMVGVGVFGTDMATTIRAGGKVSRWPRATGVLTTKIVCNPHRALSW